MGRRSTAIFWPSPTTSTEYQAAVDEAGLAGHVIRIGPGQVGHECGDVLRSLGPPQSDPFDELLIGRALRRAGEFGEPFVDRDPHIGAYHPGAVGIDGDTGARVLLRRRLGQGTNGEFRRAVHAEHGEAVVAGDRRSIDDLSTMAALDEFRGRRLYSPQ